MSNRKKPTLPYLRGTFPGFVITRNVDIPRKLNRRRTQNYRRQENVERLNRIRDGAYDNVIPITRARRTS